MPQYYLLASISTLVQFHLSIIHLFGSPQTSNMRNQVISYGIYQDYLSLGFILLILGFLLSSL